MTDDGTTTTTTTTTTPPTAAEAAATTTPTTKIRYFICDCGKFQMKLHGDSPDFVSNCNCHSCVASAKYITETYGQTEDKAAGKIYGGGTGIAPDVSANGAKNGNAGGACYICKICNIEIMKTSDGDDDDDGGKDDGKTDGTSAKFGFVKVGPKGTIVRAYTKCCGTQIMSTGSKFPGPSRNVNRNCVYEDIEKKLSYVDANQEMFTKDPIMHTMAAYSFDPDVIPEPKHSYFPFNFVLLKTMYNILSYELFGMGGKKTETDIDNLPQDEKLLFYVNPRDVDDVVPITW